MAEALAYSPSSVSVQLAELEREAGTKLLRRVGRNVELTPAGARLAAYAERALADDEAIRADLASVGDAPRGRLRMTFVQTPALALLPDALERLAAAAPDLGGLVASGRAVTLLPARLTSSLPQIAARRLREERLQRTIFAAARTSARGAPAVAAVRDALAATADAIARRRPDLDRPR